MSKKKPANPNEPERPRVHKELDGFNIQINSFGEITNSYDIDRINQFLNKTVDDKKLRHRDDLKKLRGEVEPAEDATGATDDEDDLPPAPQDLDDELDPADLPDLPDEDDEK